MRMRRGRRNRCSGAKDHGTRIRYRLGRGSVTLQPVLAVHKLSIQSGLCMGLLLATKLLVLLRELALRRNLLTLDTFPIDMLLLFPRLHA